MKKLASWHRSVLSGQCNHTQVLYHSVFACYHEIEEELFWCNETNGIRTLNNTIIAIISWIYLHACHAINMIDGFTVLIQYIKTPSIMAVSVAKHGPLSPWEVETVNTKETVRLPIPRSPLKIVCFNGSNAGICNHHDADGRWTRFRSSHCNANSWYFIGKLSELTVVALKRGDDYIRHHWRLISMMPLPQLLLTYCQ